MVVVTNQCVLDSLLLWYILSLISLGDVVLI